MTSLESWQSSIYKWNTSETPSHLIRARLPEHEWEHQINALSKLNFTDIPGEESSSASKEYEYVLEDDSSPAFRVSDGRNRRLKKPDRASKFKKGTGIFLNSSAKFPAGRGRGNKTKPVVFADRRQRRSGNRRVGPESSDGDSGGFLSRISKPLFSKKRKDKGKGETIWLESKVEIPGFSGKAGGTSSGNYGSSSSSHGHPYGSSSSSSSSAGPKKKSKGSFHCSIGRREKGDDAALITLGSIGIPLAIAGALFGGSLGGGTLTNLATAISTGIQNIINAITGNGRALPENRSLVLWSPLMWPSVLRKVLKFNWKSYSKVGRSMQDSFSIILWSLATSQYFKGTEQCSTREPKDLGSDMEFIDENEIVLRMLDDLMMTYKYGYVPKCTRSHICKLNKAAASGGQPQSTIVPLMSLPAAWLLGKPSSNVMDFLHAVWLGRNEKDCDEVYPECSDIYSSLRFRGGGANSTDTELEADLHMDELLNDLRYLEENNQMAPAAETNQDRKEDDPKEEKTT